MGRDRPQVGANRDRALDRLNPRGGQHRIHGPRPPVERYFSSLDGELARPSPPHTEAPRACSGLDSLPLVPPPKAIFALSKVLICRENAVPLPGFEAVLGKVMRPRFACNSVDSQVEIDRP
jgi:hypothetical protein